MTLSRRSFLSAAAAAGLAPEALRAATGGTADAESDAAAPRFAAADHDGPRMASQVAPDRFDPWVEVLPEALARNVETVGRLTHGRPILAVVKNNAYGLGLLTAARLLEPMDEIAGFAVVKTDAALALREGGITKPVLHMGVATHEDGAELARAGVQPALFTDDALERVQAMSRAVGGPVDAHVYLDTGMSRMGMPWHRARPWLEELSRHDGVRIRGAFTELTEDPEFDREQVSRFEALTSAVRTAGMQIGTLHAASSAAVYDLPEAHLDMVRPGIALYGSYPNDGTVQSQKARLRCAFRLRARVVRVERLRPGDGVSYGRNYIAERPVWIATIPAGHVDGVPRQAVEGARVLIGERTYPVIGAVSASHSIVELGPDTNVRIGDVATLLGPDHPDVEPWRVADATGASVYDLLMHLSRALPRVVV